MSIGNEKSACWADFFSEQEREPYFVNLKDFVSKERKTKVVFPSEKDVFKAFELTPYDQVKVVIVGQDPYSNPGQAMGLCFSVKEGVPLPPSLKNIYKEIENEFGRSPNFDNGDLSYLARQGVLLLNANLTVVEGQPLSHKLKEYKVLLSRVFGFLEASKKPIFYLLWGTFAKNLAKYITNPKHGYCACNHPSPLSANRGGWFGMGQFCKANLFLEQNGLPPIDWVGN